MLCFEKPCLIVLCHFTEPETAFFFQNWKPNQNCKNISVVGLNISVPALQVQQFQPSAIKIWCTALHKTSRFMVSLSALCKYWYFYIFMPLLHYRVGCWPTKLKYEPHGFPRKTEPKPTDFFRNQNCHSTTNVWCLIIIHYLTDDCRYAFREVYFWLHVVAAVNLSNNCGIDHIQLPLSLDLLSATRAL